MDATEPLLEAVGVPRQVVVHHQVRALEVDAFTCRVRRQQHLHLGVVLERLLRLQPLLAPHPTVDDHHGVCAAEQGGDATLEIVQRVPVFGKQDQLLRGRWDGRRDSAVVIGRRPRQGAREWRGAKQLAEQAREFAPLRILSAATHASRQRLEPLQRDDFQLQFGNRAGGGGLIHDLFGDLLLLSARGVLQFVDVFLGERGKRVRHRKRHLGAALEQFFGPQALLQPFTSPLQRLEDGFGRRGQPALKNRQRKADRAGTLLVL